MTSQLHQLGLGAQFFGQTPVQVLKSANFKENCDVGGTCPDISPQGVPISVRTEWGTSAGDASGGVQPGSGPTGRGEGTVYRFCCLSISPSDQRGSDKHLSAARDCLLSPSTHIPRFLDEYIPSSLSLWVSVTETHM